MPDVNETSTYNDYIVDDFGPTYFYYWMLYSFLFCLFIHHVLSPFVFRRHNRAYREFTRAKRMEWDSRLVSSIHATVVSGLCVSTLVKDSKIWMEPLNYPSTSGLTALSISVGYFLCDMVSMPLYWRGKELLIFTLHHAAAAFAFQQVVHYRVCTFFGVYRLTTELSTPFINQRWFYRTIGYKPDRRRVCTVTLLFAVLFAITRNFMSIPFWFIAYRAFTSTNCSAVRKTIPWLDFAFLPPPLILDCLNIYWASKAYRIGWRAAKTLWHADWRTDIKLAQARFRRKWRRIRQRQLSESCDQVAPPTQPVKLQSEPEFVDRFLQESSSSSYSSETEYEPLESDEERVQPETVRDVAPEPANLDSDQSLIQRRQ
ncbi:hypothetical protein X801_02638 [Opisthorchis viverrini]|uniref:Uncharacterized protein n=2 Tax=Opisthorchis viverrini TaxID=6198 RepID=A0A1S8X469_OPIVI|nr:hypothetical protein T265_03854 [Opisthorchis viverrini]KER29557.1 hypothetical protein T265_03854 [Opisthorchis viverrini]OON21466.1 hypothetical protein X801_02638 [Opisthorchis viverrini]